VAFFSLAHNYNTHPVLISRFAIFGLHIAHSAASKVELDFQMDGLTRWPKSNSC
jgi:hypothetical protein